MRTVSIRLADLEKTTIPIGFVGENLYTQVRIDCLKLYEEYPSAVPSLTIKPPKGNSYPSVVTRENNIVIWNVSNADLVHQGNGELQLAFIVDEIVAKSYVGRLRVSRSITPDGEAPDPIQNWIDEANAALGTIEGAVQAAEDARDLSEAWATGGSSGTPSATNNAMYYANLAEQSANTAGFMDFVIDENGKLIYTRTSNADADFDIDSNGHLLLEMI